MPKLKVFCATSGFHDSVVAAPSRPAALKAWGARTDLFSMGVARQVTDPKIVRRALEKPGEVVRISRSGSEASPAPKKAAKAKARAKPPSRAKLAAAEKRLDELRNQQSLERETLQKQLITLERKLGQLDKSHAKTRRTAEEKLDDVRQAYQTALSDWDA